MPTTALQVGGGPGGGNTPNIGYWNDSATTQVDAAVWTAGGWYRADTEGTGAMQVMRMDITGSSGRVIVDRNYTSNKWTVNAHDGTSNGNQDSGTTPAANNADTGEWHHIAVAVDGANGTKLFINAVQVAHNTRDMSPLSGLDVDQVVFGSERNLNEALEGLAQNFTIYDGALSAAEVADMMLETPPATIGGHAQRGYYEGTAANDPFTDLSGNGADTPGFASGWTPAYSSTGGIPYPSGGGGNSDPIAVAGGDQLVTEGTLVTLNASASTDPDGDTLSFSWTQTSGGAVVLTGADTATPTFTAPAAGATLVFEVEVSDGTATDTDTVTITTRVAPENTMLVGVNLQYCAYFDENFAFKDLFRRAEKFRRYPAGSGNATGRYEPGDADVDENGYPTSITPGTEAGSLCWFGIETPSSELAWHEGTWHIYHDGTGTWELGTNAAPEGLTYVEPGHYTFTIAPNVRIQTLQIRISATSPSPNHLRNFRIVHEDDLATYETQPYRQQYLDSVDEITNGVLRFMDMQETNNSEQELWANRSTSDKPWGREWGVPLETLCLLANTLQRDAWFCVPHMADDNYITEMARVIRDELDPGLTCYIEYSNECWNSQFTQTHYVRDQAALDTARFGTAYFTGGQKFTAARSVDAFTIFETEFGGLSRLKRVLPGQSANSSIGSNVLAFENAYQSADAYTIAPYVGGRFGRGDKAQEVLDDDWDIARLTSEMLVDIASGGTIRQDVIDNKAVADTYSLPLICYEGGQHLVGTGSYQNNETLTTLFNNANRDPLMGPVYDAYLQMLQEEGIEEIALFSHMFVYSKFGSWGLQEFYGQDPRPKWEAVVDWIGGTTLSNTPPEADAGPSRTVFAGALVGLDATGSIDVDMDSLTYAWVQKSGDAVTLTGADTATPTFTPATAGVRVFEVTVGDGQVSDIATVTITVTDAPVESIVRLRVGLGMSNMKLGL